MRLKEFQKKLDEMWDRLEERGVRVKRILPEDSVEENTSEDNQVTIGAIFMPPRINRRGKWQAHKRKQAEENDNDSQ